MTKINMLSQRFDPRFCAHRGCGWLRVCRTPSDAGQLAKAALAIEVEALERRLAVRHIQHYTSERFVSAGKIKIARYGVNLLAFGT